ncbi:uncharacterized protein LOC126373462 [Pectinophora gossypiella]|uniref:uncharacterized protein LOC126373462 n=1 Tax=Pectinophora gossypiella TaxID=13191 RepID=UPI00214E0E38|nr:uncharacterized protein LOC126373462 [Pectinophora gossypiella]
MPPKSPKYLPAKQQKAPAVDLAELCRKKFLAKCRFKALVRRVIANLYWLAEDEELYEGDDVKRRVEQAMRAKTRKKTLLNINDKALLNKPAEQRTEAEKKYIYRKIGGLKCFKRYPNHVKRRLAAATYFTYYGPNRVIVRQHQDAHALYFVVSGEVTVSVLVFDELLQKNVSVNVFVMHGGDMFGEVSLLHNVKRTATCITTDHCEFLALMKEDFKNVLQASLQKQWDDVKQAMLYFNYFDGLDEVAQREGCIVAKMKKFETHETILGDGVGLSNFVYFVLSGRCQMTESLKISVKENMGKQVYTLFDPFVQTTDSELELHNKYFKSPPNTSSKLRKESITSPARSSLKARSSDPVNLSKHTSELATSSRQSKLESTSIGTNISKKTTFEEAKSEPKSDKEEEFIASDAVKNDPHVRTDSIIPEKVLLAVRDEPRPSIRYSLGEELKQLQTAAITSLRTYFMQVCIFNPGSTFGFGENMRDRRIVALTPVNCMLLPKMWLLQRNTANIWSRIQHYLEKKIPTKKQLFDEFVNQRKWREYRDSVVEEIVSRSNTINYTTVHDVPYSIRMEELFDI